MPSKPFTPMYSRRELLAGASVVALIGTTGAFLSAKEAAAPNFIIFIADDLKWNVLGFEGHPLVKTPNIDRLARQGSAFLNSFVTTPICASARASMLTSTYFARHGFNFDGPGLDPQLVDISFPVLLKQHGYVTANIGKLGVWLDDGLVGALGRRLGLSTLHGGMFDVFEPIPPIPVLVVDADGVERHSLDRVGIRAQRFLRDIAGSSPFCLMVGFNEPHILPSNSGKGRFEASPNDKDLLPGASVPTPESASEVAFEQLPDVIRRNALISGAEAVQWTADPKDNEYLDYFRLVMGVDRVIGDILDELTSLGLSDSTIILFTADNGLSLGDHKIFGKWTHLDESIRVPLVIFDPRRPSPETRPVEFALNVDIAPTILEMAGIDMPKEYQGESLVGIIDGRRPIGWRSEFLIEHRADGPPDLPDWIGIRAADFSFAVYEGDNGPEYYLSDLSVDPSESTNLANMYEHRDRVFALARRASELQRGFAAALTY